jgi:hypothetical protein
MRNSHILLCNTAGVAVVQPAGSWFTLISVKKDLAVAHFCSMNEPKILVDEDYPGRAPQRRDDPRFGGRRRLWQWQQRASAHGRHESSSNWAAKFMFTQVRC